MLDRAREILRKAGIEGRQLEQTMEGLLRVVDSAKKAGDEFQLDQGIRNFFTDEVGLDEKQVGVVIRLGQRIANSGDRE